MVACRAFRLCLQTDCPGYMGEERSANQLPFRSLIDAGVIISMNADAPSTYPDWRAGVQAAVMREARQVGQGIGPNKR